jgi:GDP-L-fucose synthase
MVIDMKKIYVAGHNGMVGSAICRKLQYLPDVDVMTQTRKELDLCNQASVLSFMQENRPDEVIIAAAKVGGIHANNTLPADFIYQNLQIQSNLIHAAHLSDVQKLLFLGSSCIYPRSVTQPMREDALLTDVLEPTNEPYAIAKISGIKMCESYNRQYGRDYRSVMPSNLYGPGDNYHPEHSHVVPALILRLHEAKKNNLDHVLIWGSGTPKREFLYVDDMADASLFVHNLDAETYAAYTKPTLSHINVGAGTEVTIKQLANILRGVVGFGGDLVFDRSKPDGSPRKIMDISLLSKLGWSASMPLIEGLALSYADFKRRIS